MSKDMDISRVQAALDTLSEHFDSVQIFTTRHESGVLHGTIKMSLGAGNWFTRFGQINEWLIIENERARLEARDS